jgi:hypothetical protein
MEMDNNRRDDEKQRRESQHYWDAAAASFDNEPDHGLRDPLVREAWTKLLEVCFKMLILRGPRWQLHFASH